MSDNEAHQFSPATPSSKDLIFDCPSCHSNLGVDPSAAGHEVNCPSCGNKIKVPELHEVVSLSEAPETQQLQAMPDWKQELVSIESSLLETTNQREEAGNHYKHHVSEANRLKLRAIKLDERLKELQERKAAILAKNSA